MLKFTIILCATVLVASGAAIDTAESMFELLRWRLNTDFDDTIFEMDDMWKITMNKIDDYIDDANATMIKSVRKAHEDVVHRINEETIDGVNYAECYSEVVELERKRHLALDTMVNCAMDVTDHLHESRTKMFQLFERASYNLDTRAQAIVLCRNEIDSQISGEQGKIMKSTKVWNEDPKAVDDCLEKVVRDATKIKDNAVSLMTNDNISLYEFLQASEKTFDQCASSTDFSKFDEESLNAVNRATECIRRKTE